MSALASLERFGEEYLVFLNWRSCRHCLQNEWPLVSKSHHHCFWRIFFSFGNEWTLQRTLDWSNLIHLRLVLQFYAGVIFMADCTHSVLLKTTILQTRFQLMSFSLKSICKFKTKLKSVLIQYLTWCNNQKKSFHTLAQKTWSRAVNMPIKN